MNLKKLHKPLGVLFITLLMSSYSHAMQLRLMSGTKTQSLTTGQTVENPGGGPLGLITFVDFGVWEKLYLSVGTSFEFNLSGFATSGFSLYGQAMYYFIGKPEAINSQSTGFNMDLYHKYSLYGSVGIFDKEIRVRIDNNEFTTERDVGGLAVGFGGNYNLNPKLYLTGHFQMLMSERQSEGSFSSTEVYVGIGFRI